MTDGEEVVRYAKKAMIVAPQPEPTEAGADVLREGGNAVDAGIACALVQGVVDPLMTGIAGFGSAGIYFHRGIFTSISTSMRRHRRRRAPTCGKARSKARRGTATASS
jgi:gamma-glutamyltranspeptidase